MGRALHRAPSGGSSSKRAAGIRALTLGCGIAATLAGACGPIPATGGLGVAEDRVPRTAETPQVERRDTPGMDFGRSVGDDRDGPRDGLPILGATRQRKIGGGLR